MKKEGTDQHLRSLISPTVFICHLGSTIFAISIAKFQVIFGLCKQLVSDQVGKPEESVCSPFQFETCQKCFGFTDDKSMQPDEFFKIFDSFISSMADAKEENERIKKQREEEERRAQLEEKVRL